MCFWYQTGAPPGIGSGERRRTTTPPVVVLRGEDLVASRVVDARSRRR